MNVPCPARVARVTPPNSTAAKNARMMTFFTRLLLSVMLWRETDWLLGHE